MVFEFALAPLRQSIFVFDGPPEPLDSAYIQRIELAHVRISEAISVIHGHDSVILSSVVYVPNYLTSSSCCPSFFRRPPGSCPLKSSVSVPVFTYVARQPFVRPSLVHRRGL